MKKLLSILTLAMMAPVMVFAGTFSDVDSDNRNFYAIETLKAFDIVEGYDDGRYGFDEVINRAELMKILVVATGNDTNADEDSYSDCFPDVTDQWFARHVCYAESEGWVDGYSDGTFKPGDDVNKVEALKMIVNSRGLGESLATEFSESGYDDVDTDDWFMPYVEMMYRFNALEITSGDLGPSEDLKRGTMAEYIFRLMVATYAGDVYSEGYRNGYFAANDLGYIYALEFDDASDPSDTDYDTADDADDTDSGGTDAFNGEGIEISEFAYYTTPEYVEITNNGNETVRFQGWRLEGYSNFNTYIWDFPDSLTLDPGNSLKVYSDTGNYAFRVGEDIWNDTDSEIRIYDETDYLIYYEGDVLWD